jgi:uncharacterized membrane-anchored protein YjiN (DUF445 family)
MKASAFSLLVKHLRTPPRTLAVFLLCFVALGFVCTRVLEKSVPGLAWIRAFCEAALVGGIADWFAVVALFRHPLGVPVPHTAILPKRQRELGQSLGGFVVNNFLTTQVVEPWLHTFSFATRTGEFLRQKSESVATLSVHALPRILDAIDQSRITPLVLDQTKLLLQRISLAPALGEILDLTTKGNLHEAALNHILRLAGELLGKNMDLLRTEIAKEVPLPDFTLLDPVRELIADYVAERTMARIHATLTAAAQNPDHMLRQEFRSWLQREIHHLRHSAVYLEKGEEIKNRLLQDPALAGYAEQLWLNIRDRIQTDVASADSKIHAAVARFCLEMGHALERDPELRMGLDAQLRGGILALLEKHRDAVGRLIADTVSSWKSEQLVARVENAVGEDLQFIRINGTLVGGLVGLLLHAVGWLFGI